MTYTARRLDQFSDWLKCLKDGLTWPGWRKYQRGETLNVMLAGGDKSTQQADIRRAIALAKSLED